MRNGHHQQQQQKRMRGRNRNNNRGHNPLTRVYESNGPDVKVRGTAHHIAEKYIQLARDSQSSGDPVSSEGYLQHAEHYFRLIAAAQAQYAQQNPNQPQQVYQRPDMDGDYEEGEGGEGASDFNAQPYAGGQPVQPVQRPPYQNQPQPQQSQPQPQPQPSFQPQPQNSGALPAFITGGGAPQQGNQNNGYDNEQGEQQRGNRNDRNDRNNRYGRNRNRNFRHGGGNNDQRGGYQRDQEPQPQPNAAPVATAPVSEQNQSDAASPAPQRNDSAE
jgi:hypothetical protein